MNIESRRIDSSTATTATRIRRPKVGVDGIRPHNVWAAKKVAKRMAMAAASSAFAVTRYRSAARSSQTTRRPTATMTPIATRTGGASQPRSSEYLKKKIAARTSAMPAMAENSLTPTSCSQSKPAHGAAGAGRAGIGWWNG